MGTYVNNNKVTLGTSYDYDDAVKEIAELLEVGPGADGKYHLADICQAPSINMWARYKPFGYNSDNFGYDPKNPSVANAERASKAKLANYGITLSGTGYGGTQVVQMAKDVINRNYSWTYTPPKGRTSGNDSEPFRLRDFDGYCHSASSPIASPGSLETTTDKSTCTISPYFEVILAGNSDSLSLSELKTATNQDGDFSGMYMGMCCVDPNSYQSSSNTFSRIYYSIGSKTYGEYLTDTQHDEISMSFNVSVPNTTNSSYNYTCFVFFASQQNVANASLYPIPFATMEYKVTKKVLPTYVWSSVASAFMMSDTTRPLYYRGEIFNPNESRSETINYRIVGLKSNNWGDEVYTLASGTITVPPRTTVYVPDDNGGQYSDYFYLKDMSYIKCDIEQSVSSAERRIGYIDKNMIYITDAPFDPFA